MPASRTRKKACQTVRRQGAHDLILWWAKRADELSELMDGIQEIIDELPNNPLLRSIFAPVDLKGVLHTLEDASCYFSGPSLGGLLQENEGLKPISEILALLAAR